MAKPSDKSEGLEQAMKGMFGFDRRDNIRKNECCPEPIGCGGPAVNFKDDISRTEYTLSGLCQKCQDSVFGSSDED